MTKKRIIKSIFYAVIAALLCVVTVICGQFNLSAFADTVNGTRAAYENTNVWDNLQGSTLGGNAFNIEDYPHKENGKPQIISFVEFCYSYYSDKQSDYGLYVYVYNPQDLAFDTNTERNKIQFKYGTANYNTYSLEFLNYSKATGYEGRFYKFKIALSDTQRRNVLNTVKENGRVYEVSGFTLTVKGVATEYTCAQKYTYTGFVKGYGSELAESDTLSCTVDGFDKYVELDVKHTVYRPQGDYYEGKQSQLNSCYFRVPEKFFEDYGNLSKIACEWYEYVTQPMLVTQDDYLYQRLYALSGGNVNNFYQSMYFLMCAFGNTDESLVAKKVQNLGLISNFENFENDYTFVFGDGITSLAARGLNEVPRFNNFAAVFYSGRDKSYKDRYVTSEEIQSQLIANSEKLGEPYLTERYSETLFSDTVNPDHTRGLNKKEIPADYKHDVFWTMTTKSMWQTIFGGYDVETLYDAVTAIVTVNESDLTGTNEEISKRLYVAEGDVASLKNEYKKAVAKGERLVLFRFGESDYYSMPIGSSYCAKSTEKADEALIKDLLTQMNRGEYSGYIAQETVYLDFDIISLWFTADDVETEIPVISSPVDVISGLTPPLDENYSNQGKKSLFMIILAAFLVIMLIVGIVVVFKIILPIIYPKKVKLDVTDKQRKKR